MSAATMCSLPACCITVFAVLCVMNGLQVVATNDLGIQARQGLGGETSPLLQQASLAQLLQPHNSPLLTLQQPSLNMAGLGLGRQALPLPLQGLAGTQFGGLGGPFLGNQGLSGLPLATLGMGLGGTPLLNPAGLGSSQFLGNPGLLGLSGVNRLGGLGASGQLANLPPALQQSLFTQQPPITSNNLGDMIRLASLLLLPDKNSDNNLHPVHSVFSGPFKPGGLGLSDVRSAGALRHRASNDQLQGGVSRPDNVQFVRHSRTFDNAQSGLHPNTADHNHVDAFRFPQ